MAQNLAADFPIDPAVTSGTQLAERLNRLERALYTTASGDTIPPDNEAGLQWLDTTTATAPIWKHHDGTDDIVIGQFDYTNNKFLLGSNGTASIAGTGTDLGNDIDSRLEFLDGESVLAGEIGYKGSETFAIDAKRGDLDLQIAGNSTLNVTNDIVALNSMIGDLTLQFKESDVLQWDFVSTAADDSFELRSYDAGGLNAESAFRATRDGAFEIYHDGVLSLQTESSKALRLIGSGTGSSNVSFIRFLESDNSTQRGFVGQTGVDRNIYLACSDAADQIRFPVGPTTRAIISSDGITVTGGISFDSGANRLSRYEEGTWTPTVTNGITGITYAAQVGEYQIIGNRCYFSFWVDVSSGTIQSGGVLQFGLPFTSGSSSQNTYSASISFLTNFLTMPTMLVLQNSSILRCYNLSGSNYLGGQLASADIILACSGFYRI